MCPARLTYVCIYIYIYIYIHTYIYIYICFSCFCLFFYFPRAGKQGSAERAWNPQNHSNNTSNNNSSNNINDDNNDNNHHHHHHENMEVRALPNLTVLEQGAPGEGKRPPRVEECENRTREREAKSA